ncbi:MAG: 3'(2'),5'-bisphosphate nucleotidase [Marine Group II euryarchaeote MED-G37]|nr:MAG: 3'(2'),5'-bisphosphate nucleotidase [Marine Group II euryarchaeote MED-G37]
MLATDEELTSFDGSVELLKDHIENQLTKNPPKPSISFTPEKIVEIATQAGEAIMDVYENAEDFEITQKGDESPLTKADIAAHDVIVAGLQSIDSTPIVSEEGRVGDPMSSNTCWLVDPLDGTKEFIKRNGMFTVNIALMQRNESRWKPLFGVVHAPASDTTWFGGALAASQRDGPEGSGPMMVRPTEGKVKLVASGSHRGEKDESFAEAVGEHELVRMGSSLKACIVAEGGADIYPRFGPTSCWDIAAAHAVVSGAGGIVVGPDGKTLDYDLVEEVLNPYFLVAADNRWTEIWIQHQ